MKKMIAVVFCLVLVLSLAGCVAETKQEEKEPVENQQEIIDSTVQDNAEQTEETDETNKIQETTSENDVDTDGSPAENTQETTTQEICDGVPLAPEGFTKP